MTNAEKYKYIINRLERISTPTGISYSGDETICSDDVVWLEKYLKEKEKEIYELKEQVEVLNGAIEKVCNWED